MVTVSGASVHMLLSTKDDIFKDALSHDARAVSGNCTFEFQQFMRRSSSSSSSSNAAVVFTQRQFNQVNHKSFSDNICRGQQWLH
jgi:hypothetical protein